MLIKSARVAAILPVVGQRAEIDRNYLKPRLIAACADLPDCVRAVPHPRC
jgi:hypothetical protein